MWTLSFRSQVLGSVVVVWEKPKTTHNGRVWSYVAQSLNGADAGRGQVDRVLKDVEFPVTKRVTWTREQSLAGHRVE